MTDVTPQQPLHPLRAKELQLISTWSEWRKLWEEEVHPERLIGLLHIGFDVPLDTEESDRILFYFSIADGHTSGIGSWEEERQDLNCTSFGQRITWAGIRQRVAQKAFRELCHHIFKTTAESRDKAPSWLRMITEDLCCVLDVVLTFFLERSPSEIEFGKLLRNLPRDEKSYEYGIAISFLTDLCALTWGLLPLFHYADVRNIQDRLWQYRSQFVRVLAGMDKLSLLEREETDLDDACCEMLRAHFKILIQGRTLCGGETLIPQHDNSWQEKRTSRRRSGACSVPSCRRHGSAAVLAQTTGPP